jgi:hypothetical protein
VTIVASDDEPEIEIPENDAVLISMPTLTQPGDATISDFPADTSDGSSLTPTPDPIIIDPFAEEPGAETSEDDTVSITLSTLTPPVDPEPINLDISGFEEPSSVPDANPDSSFEPGAANFDNYAASFSNHQDLMEEFHLLAQDYMNQMEPGVEPFPEEPL